MLKIDIREKSFGRKIIFKDFEYTFSPSGIYIITGPSGVGKTTLLRIIAGLDRNFTGTVSGGAFANVSYHFQEYRLFDNLTVLDNVLKISFKEDTPENIHQTVSLLKRLGFTEEELNHFPPQLSGGMKQRVSFARAILKKSPILLLDEPTKELDSLLVDEICKIIEEEAKYRTVILVTHIDHTHKFSSYTLLNL